MFITALFLAAKHRITHPKAREQMEGSLQVWRMYTNGPLFIHCENEIMSLDCNFTGSSLPTSKTSQPCKDIITFSLTHEI